jgi:hypothetical protein
LRVADAAVGPQDFYRLFSAKRGGRVATRLPA